MSLGSEAKRDPVCRTPNFFIVPTTLPAKTVADPVPLAKAKVFKEAGITAD